MFYQWFINFLIKSLYIFGGAVTRQNKSDIKKRFFSSQLPSDLAGISKVSDCTGQLVEELHKSIFRKFEKGKVHSLFKDNI